MCKRIIYVLTIVFLLSVGFFWGTKAEKYQTIKAEDKSTISTIAVVNLDEGIAVDGEKVNYAAKLIVFPDTNFVMTSLVDAREGIATDKYAAYVIVPSTFSQSTVSVNAKPEKANIEYAVNDNLREDIMIKIVGDINNFNLSLSSNMAYMYVSAILEEFHTAQDTAGTIMTNDSKDAELVSSVAPDTLLTNVDYTELVQTESKIKPIDLNSSYQTAEQTVNQLGSEYKGYIEKGKAEFADVKEGEGKVTQAVTEADTAMKGIDIEKNKEGVIVYQAGIEEIGVVFEDTNKKIEEQKSVIKTFLTIPPIVVQEGIIPVNQQETPPIPLQKKIEIYNESIKILLDEIQAEVDKIEREATPPEVPPEEPTTEAPTTEAPDTIVKGHATNKTAVKQEEAKAEEVKTEESKTEEPKAEEAKAEEAKAEEAKAEEAKAEEAKAEEAKMDDKKTEVSKLEVVSITGTTENRTDEIKAVQVTTVSGMSMSTKPTELAETTVVPPVSPPVPPTIDPEVAESINAIREKLKSLTPISIDSELLMIEKEIDNMPVIMIDEVDVIVKENIVSPIQEECKSETAMLAAKTDEVKIQMEIYSEVLKEYDPLKYVEHENINAHLSSLNSNITGMETEIDKTNGEYLDEVSQVHTDANENITALQKNMDTAYEATGNNIVSTMDSLKKSRNAVNEQNVTILSELTQKLPYTRLGSVEFTEAYDFIVNPISVENKGADVTIQVKQLQNNPKDMVQAILVIICGVTGSAILILLTVSRIKEKKEEKAKVLQETA